MGQNLHALVTKVSNSEDGKYSLWEREQVVVLLSRTNYARDIIFVGSKRDTVNSLAAVLTQRSQYSEYISHLLTRLSGLNEEHAVLPSIEIDIAQHPFRPVDVEIPYDNTGYCYLLVSLRETNTTYIGQTNNIRRRLREHNTGYGSVQTTDERLRPWALLTLVCGFQCDRRAQQEFECRWQNARFYENRRRGGVMTPTDIGQLAGSVITHMNAARIHSPLDLRIIHCGTVA